MKKMKVSTKVIVGLLILDLMTLVCLVCGYKTVNHLLEIKDQASYIQNYNIFAGCLLAVCIVVGSIIVIDVTKTLKKSICCVTFTTHHSF